MIISSISIRSKLQLTTLVITIILAVLAIIYVDATKQNVNQSELLKSHTSFRSEYLLLSNTYQRMLLDGGSSLIATSIGQTRKIEEKLRELIRDDSRIPTGQQYLHEQLVRKRDQIIASLNRLAVYLRTSAINDSSGMIKSRTEMEILSGLVEDFEFTLLEFQEVANKKNTMRLSLSLTLAIIFVTAYLLIFTMNLTGSFKKLALYTSQLRNGTLPPPLNISSGDEFSQIAEDLNEHSAELQKKIDIINSLSDEGPGTIIEPGNDDELGKSLLLLSEVLIRKEVDEVSRNREDKKLNWISEGLAQMGEILRSERENVTELSYLIIQKLVTYMNVEMGSLFITNDSDPENLSLDLVSSYAYDRRKYISRNFGWGVGLPGTCAREKERIFITDVPEDYFEVTSGTGSSIPNCLLFVPLKIDEVVFGVIELATIRLLRPFEIEFVESMSESIASSILAVRNSERTSGLLKQSQAQAETLKNQESAMRDNMEKLEEAQRESGKKEVEITGIVNALNQSVLVAELGINGRFSSINDKFLMLLETSREQVLGKQYSEFAMADPYSDEYKAFWTSLREGTTISKTEQYKLFLGKVVWLQQTFTPIINSEGKVYKILNIAVDITENRILQEQLEARKLEITRSGLDMQTLKEAVNTALIKCELDAEGIIMDVNDNYSEVTGYGRKELMGRNYRLFLKDTEKEQFEKIWAEVIKEKVYEGVIRRSKPTGEEVWLVSTFSPVKDEAGVIYKIYYMGLDITEKKLKYQLLEDANQEIDRLKDRLKEYEL